MPPHTYHAPREARQPAQSRAFRPLRRPGYLAALLKWVGDHPGIDVPAYLVWAFTGAGWFALVSFAGAASASKLVGVALVLLAALFGALTILLSRPLAYGREETPWLVRYLGEGWWSAVDYGPGTFRFLGSCGIGVAAGNLAWIIVPKVAVAIVTGLVVLLGVWVWTWFAFDEMEE